MRILRGLRERAFQAFVYRGTRLRRFADVDDYRQPFPGGQGPASGYAVSLDEARQSALRERIRQRLPFARDGSITLNARAWAARGDGLIVHRVPGTAGR